jgi:phosphoglycerate kinase
MRPLSLRDLDLKGQKVLMRVDFNVPQNSDGTIADDTRIREALPSIKYVLDQGASLILMSHLGRPKAKKDPQFSLKCCAERLEQQLNRPVKFAPDCIGSEVEKLAHTLKSGEILLLENLRFYAAEEDPDTDPSFAKKLAALGTVYVNDAFGTAHRKHSSTATIAAYFPGKSAAGFLMEKELDFLEKILAQPKHPFYAVIGGSKVSSKIGMLQALLEKTEAIFIGGAMAFTFFKAQGLSIGDSLHEDSLLGKAAQFLENCKKKKIPVHLPKDLIIADKFQNTAATKTISVAQGIPNGWQGMDIGPETVNEWQSLLQKAATVFWNGPLGVFEFPHFAAGTNQIAQAIAHLKATTLVGGGDSVAAINKLDLAPSFSHVSTGGGAVLEFLEFGHLPGVDALNRL